MRTNTLLAAATLLALAQCVGCMSEVDSDLDELDGETGESLDPIVNGITTTAFAPVVQISWSKSVPCGIFNTLSCTETHPCTATAIADDLLVTASQCVRHGTATADYVKVATAHGANSGAAGKTSSYFIMSQDLHDNGDANDYNSYAHRDFTFIKFGAGTFPEYYGTTYASSSPVGSLVTKVGFGEDSTKEYATKTIDKTSTYDGGDYRVSGTSRSGAYSEYGDQGGPILKKNGTTGEYEVLGVVYGTAFWGGVEYDSHPTFTSAMETNILSKLRTSLPKYCVESYEHADYGGFPWSLCNSAAVDNDLDSFSDPFIARSHWNYGDWNDKMSSLELPTANTVLTLYQDSGQGGSSVTFQNLYDFGNGSAVPNLTDEGFNDKVSSYSMVSGASKNNTDWNIELTRYGKCIDTSFTHTAGTDVYQWSCQSGNGNQVFRMQASSGYYQIKHTASGLCLGTEGGGTSNGTPIELQTCDGSSKQLFDIYSNASTATVRDFQMKNVNSGKCMDLYQGASNDGTAIKLWSCSTTNLNQNFALKEPM